MYTYIHIMLYCSPKGVHKLVLIIVFVAPSARHRLYTLLSYLCTYTAIRSYTQCIIYCIVLFSYRITYFKRILYVKNGDIFSLVF